MSKKNKKKKKKINSGKKQIKNVQSKNDNKEILDEKKEEIDVSAVNDKVKTSIKKTAMPSAYPSLSQFAQEEIKTDASSGKMSDSDYNNTRAEILKMARKSGVSYKTMMEHVRREAKIADAAKAKAEAEAEGIDFDKKEYMKNKVRAMGSKEAEEKCREEHQDVPIL